jgi:hypothetical protein
LKIGEILIIVLFIHKIVLPDYVYALLRVSVKTRKGALNFDWFIGDTATYLCNIHEDQTIRFSFAKFFTQV